MTAILHPFRTFRDNLRLLGTAVSVSREFSRETRPDIQPSCTGIPL